MFFLQQKKKAGPGSFFQFGWAVLATPLLMPLSFLRDAYQFWTVLLRSAWEQHSPENWNKKIFPETKKCCVSPNFYVHISVSDLYIPRIGLPIRLQQNRWIEPWEYINCSQMCKYGNWEQGCTV
jgi:hypothetical protein